MSNEYWKSVKELAKMRKSIDKDRAKMSNIKNSVKGKKKRHKKSQAKKATPRQQQAIDAIKAAKGDRGLAAAKMGVSRDTLRKLLERAAQNGALELSSIRADAEGNLKGMTFRAPKQKGLTKEEVEKLIAEMAAPKIKPRKAKASYKKNDILDAVLLGDMHLGMLAHDEESGHNWDTDLSVKAHLAAVVDLLSQGRGKKASIIAIGDILHANDQSNQTPRSGHQLDVDSRHYRTMKAARDLFASFVEYGLETHDEIELQIIRGNHDPDSAMYLALALQALYANEPRVSVPYVPAIYRHTRWGNVFIGHTHGDRASIKRLPLIYATQHPRDFAECWAGRHIFGGHIHSEKGYEDRGVTVETLQTLAPQDAYAAGAGYSSGRSASMISFHKTQGRLCRVYHNILG